ncbi:hypothetical protein V8F20_010527 [Naviculisporaceae sp. PSN 640]
MPERFRRWRHRWRQTTTGLRTTASDVIADEGDQIALYLLNEADRYVQEAGLPPLPAVVPLSPLTRWLESRNGNGTERNNSGQTNPDPSLASGALLGENGSQITASGNNTQTGSGRGAVGQTTSPLPQEQSYNNEAPDLTSVIAEWYCKELAPVLAEQLQRILSLLEENGVHFSDDEIQDNSQPTSATQSESNNELPWTDNIQAPDHRPENPQSRDLSSDPSITPRDEYQLERNMRSPHITSEGSHHEAPYGGHRGCSFSGSSQSRQYSSCLRTAGREGRRSDRHVGFAQASPPGRRHESPHDVPRRCSTSRSSQSQQYSSSFPTAGREGRRPNQHVPFTQITPPGSRQEPPYDVPRCRGPPKTSQEQQQTTAFPHAGSRHHTLNANPFVPSNPFRIKPTGRLRFFLYGLKRFASGLTGDRDDIPIGDGDDIRPGPEYPHFVNDPYYSDDFQIYVPPPSPGDRLYNTLTGKSHLNHASPIYIRGGPNPNYSRPLHPAPYTQYKPEYNPMDDTLARLKARQNQKVNGKEIKKLMEKYHEREQDRAKRYERRNRDTMRNRQVPEATKVKESSEARLNRGERGANNERNPNEPHNMRMSREATVDQLSNEYSGRRVYWEGYNAYDADRFDNGGKTGRRKRRRRRRRRRRNAGRRR